MTQAYPLQWPQGRARRQPHDRKRAKFSSKAHNGRYSYQRELTINEANDRLQGELDRIGARYPTLSSNLELRLDGQPRSGQREPDDPGVCVYFDLDGKPVAMPCDRYDRTADNIAGIAAHIEATRAIERHGVATVSEMFSGFMALPSPDAVQQWWGVLGLESRATRSEIEAAWKRLRKERHPDTPGGSTKAFQELQAAYEQGLRAA